MIIIFTFSIFIQIFIYYFYKFFFSKRLFKNYNAIQKIHEGNIPRIGGLMFFLNFLFLIFYDFNSVGIILPLICGGFIIFLFSLYEDIQQSLSPYFRLIILFLGSSLFIFFTELPEIKVLYLSLLNDIFVLKILVFTLSLMLLMNGFNFIDGLNGLSSFNFISVLLSILYLANKFEDIFLINLIYIILIISILILIFNFPYAKFFIGDSGSYLYALFSGALVIYLFQRNENLPTLLSMVILAYPITEMLFSILRKSIRGYSPMKPDTKHLHHLIFHLLSGNPKKNNFIASILMLPFCFLPFLLNYLSINYQLIGEEFIFLFYFSVYVITYLILEIKYKKLAKV